MSVRSSPGRPEQASARGNLGKNDYQFCWTRSKRASPTLAYCSPSTGLTVKPAQFDVGWREKNGAPTRSQNATSALAEKAVRRIAFCCGLGHRLVDAALSHLVVAGVMLRGNALYRHARI